MQNKMPEIPIHDIKPLVEIQEYSFYYLMALIVLALVIIGAIIYMIIRYVKSKNAFSIRKEHKNLLDTLEFSDSKSTAYLVTSYALTFKNDSLISKMIIDFNQNLHILVSDQTSPGKLFHWWIDSLELQS